MSEIEIHDATQCSLGEGPLWHPEREQLYWFDINARRMLTVEDGATRHWEFPGHVSAAGWIDADTLLVATETGLITLDLATDTRTELCAIEADDPRTRSNDGRADPMGGFWIGTMDKNVTETLGAIYRYHGGELRRLFGPLGIPNAICFAPDGDLAYFADTAAGIVWRVALDAEGWPESEPEVFVDFTDTGLRPDGAVTDLGGNLWIAFYGAGRVACHAPDGHCLNEIEFPASQVTCPAFGGPSLDRLFVTSAAQKLSTEALAATPDHGRTFSVARVAQGRPEPRVEP